MTSKLKAISIRYSALIILILILALGSFIFLKSIPKKPKKDCKDCNIILISIDTLRADRLGILGYSKKTSPNIDKFFQKGAIFTNAYSQAPWTLPSHSSMLTGQYPAKNNVEIPTDLLPTQAETIAETLRQNGFETAAITTGAFVNIDLGFGQGFDYYRKNENWQDAETMTKQAVDWLKQNRTKKIFLFLHSFQVHDPYSPQKRFIKKIDPNYKGNLNSFGIHDIVKLDTSKLNLGETDLERISSLYDGEIAQLDYYLGKVFREIKNSGLENKTIIILTSDHGEEFGERGLWGVHGYSLYDELIHVPLLIKAPQITPKKVSNLVELNDIYPTVMEILGINYKQTVDGQSLLKAYKDETDKQRVVFSETSIEKNAMLTAIEEAYNNGLTNSFRPSQRTPSNVAKTKMVRQENYKLIRNLDNSFELYDLESDPKEKSNLVNSKQEVFDRLQKELLRISQSSE